MDNESTHFIFDGEKVLISPDLHPVLIFLQGIEKEIESLLGFDQKLGSIRKQYLETIEFVQFLSKKLKDNSIDFKYTLSEHPETIAQKLKNDPPTRAEMIVLFANLETLLCLNIAYENKTSNKKEIIRKAMDPDTVRTFLDRFFLTSENVWGKKNHERLDKISSDDLRKLRNALTHFFSTDKGIAIAHSALDEKSRKLEKATDFKAKFRDLLINLVYHNRCRQQIV